MTNPLRNITAHPASTIAGLLVGVAQIAIEVGVPAAAQAFVESGGSTSWQTYAWAAGKAAIPVAIGALYAPKQPAAPPLSILDQHRAEQLAKIDAAITEAGMKAMEAKAGEVAIAVPVQHTAGG